MKRELGRIGLALAMLLGGVLLAGCGDDGGGGDDDSGLRSDLVAEIQADSTEEFPVTDEQAECLADAMIDGGFTENDFEQVQESEEGVSVSSRILDIFTDAAESCEVG